MTFDELYKTEESRWILNENSAINEVMKQKRDFSRSDFSEKQLYVLDCFMLYSRLMDTCNQLAKIPVFLRRFDKKYFLENKIGQADFIQYHLEVYIGKLFTISEIMLSLTNEIYRLNLKPKQCSLTNVVKRLDDTDSTKKILIRLFENLENWRLIRNASVHRNKFNKEESFERLSTEEFLWMTSQELGYKLEVDMVFVKPRHFVDYFLKKERKGKIGLIEKNNLGLSSYINSYFKSAINEMKNN